MPPSLPFPDGFSRPFEIEYMRLLNDNIAYCPHCRLSIRRSKWDINQDPYEYHKHQKLNCSWILKEEEHIARIQSEKAHIRAREAYQAVKEALKAKAKEEARIKSETQARQARMYAEQEARNAELKAKEKARIQAEEAARLEAFSCRRCPAKFASNTKLHEHVRDHHTKSASPTPPASSTLSLSSIKSIETPPTKLASSSKAAPPKPSLSAITSIQIAPASSTPPSKAASSSKPASSSKSAPPLTPPATPPKTWAAVASKPASKPASIASPFTPPPTPPEAPLQTRQNHIQKPLRSYLIVHDLYRMFHVKKPPHQTRITSFFKPVIEPVRNSKRNIHPTKKNTIKSLVPSLASSAAPKREIPPFTLRKPVDWSFQRYVSGLLLKMASEKRFENILHTTSSIPERITTKCPDYYGRHIKRSASRRHHLEDL